MSIAQSLFAEFQEQVPITRRFLERLPESKLGSQEKSMCAGQLAWHIARVPGGIVRFVQQNPAQAPDFNNIPQPSSLRAILDAFEQSLATVKDLLPQCDDAKMGKTWRLLLGEKELLAIPITGISTAGSSASTCASLT